MKSLALALFLALTSAPPALALERGAVVRVDARAEVAAAVYAAAATQAASERAADAQLRALRGEIERLEALGAQSRAALAEAQERFVAELAARDRAYAQEIAVFRAAVEDIAATPEGAAALARFNAGDELGALTVLDDLRTARDRARQRRADIESAAEGRRIAALALEARARGRLDTAAVIVRFEEVTQLDPSDYADWRTLSGLYEDAGQIQLSEETIVRSLAAAQAQNDVLGVAVVSLEVSDVFRRRGDLERATSMSQTTLDTATRAIERNLFAEASPRYWVMQSMRRLAYSRLSTLAYLQRDYSAAISNAVASMQLSDQLWEAQPYEGSAAFAIYSVRQRAQLVAFYRLAGDLAAAAVMLTEAETRLSGIDRSELTIDQQRDLASAISQIAAHQRQAGNIDRALVLRQEATTIRTRIANVDRTHFQDQNEAWRAHNEEFLLLRQRGETEQAVARAVAGMPYGEASLYRILQTPGEYRDSTIDLFAGLIENLNGISYATDDLEQIFNSVLRAIDQALARAPTDQELQLFKVRIAANMLARTERAGDAAATQQAALALNEQLASLRDQGPVSRRYWPSIASSAFQLGSTSIPLNNRDLIETAFSTASNAANQALVGGERDIPEGTLGNIRVRSMIALGALHESDAELALAVAEADRLNGLGLMREDTMQYVGGIRRFLASRPSTR